MGSSAPSGQRESKAIDSTGTLCVPVATALGPFGAGVKCDVLHRISVFVWFVSASQVGSLPQPSTPRRGVGL
ncbi:MAG: hypothetical protein CMJ25_24180 [Phycisphaerae bacterium]|nr:hypothetical protein [Phycisphaerae bacterium]